MLSLPKIENPIGSLVIEILKFRKILLVLLLCDRIATIRQFLKIFLSHLFRFIVRFQGLSDKKA